jgi:Protein of unknown function (DUF1236)
MKQLYLSVAGALLLAGSMAAYAQAQDSKEPLVEEQKPNQGKKPERGSQQKPQPKEEQGNKAKTGQAGEAERKGGQDHKRSEQTDKSGPSKETDKKDAMKQRGDEDKGAKSGAGSQDNKSAQKNADDNKDKGHGKRHAHKNFEPKQRTVIKETIVKRHVRPAKINFSINVGAVIPRTVTLYDLPPVFIEYEPDYANYKYILADDDTILVIDPDTWEIVDVIKI